MAKRKEASNANVARKYCATEPKECDGSCGCRNKKGGK